MAAATSPLVSVERLAGWLAEPNPPVVVDLRWYLGRPGDGRAAYVAGHIPGAIFLDLDDDLADPSGFGAPGRHPLPDPAAFAAHMAEAGIGDGARVVGYDDVGGWVAARLWWMLDNLGFGRRGIGGESVGVLDGGIGAWTASGRPLETELPQAPAHPARLSLEGRWSRVIARGELRERLGSVTLLDARGAPRYRGEVEPVDPVAGHIPTAVSAPYDTNLGPDGTLLDRGALADRYAGLGITAGSAAAADTVISCGSGTSACHHALAMRVAGLPDPILYVGSYSDWSRSGEPVATGAAPGAPPPPGPPPTPRAY
ncbi:MAG TPA: rhodanese-like domain-containing protein [Candidatus Dormibacteraeota bacterium]|nr:rhodanese-like domain-containing protein [Candidatus Dormibacteraeota bacterium]